MTREPRDTETYVLEVTESTRRYVNALRRDNEFLRELVASLDADGTRLREQVEAIQRQMREHERSHTAGMSDHQFQEWTETLRRELETLRSARDELHERVIQIDAQCRTTIEQYAAIEEQYSNLTNLYVASYRLHETLDRAEVIAIIQEIVINIVGSEELAIFELDPDHRDLVLLASHGIDTNLWRRVSVERGLIARAVRTGATWVRESGDANDALATEANLTACVPLRIDGQVTGAIVVFQLLQHKQQLSGVDHELFELLATHAANALYTTRLHAESLAAKGPRAKGA